VSEYSETEQWERAKAWLKENGLWIITGCAIGLGGLYGWRWYEARQITQAQTASARYDEMIDAFGRNDRARGMTIVDELNRDYDWTPYASLSTLIAARVHVEQNELDKAAAGLKAVMDGAKDKELRMVARVRLARVQAAQSKFDEALKTLTVAEAGEFATRLADARGDVLLAKGDRAGALREYLAARTGDNKGRIIDTDLLDLKIRDLGGTPPKAPEENASQDS
jgi:predicted negative regulator of RcsB-dependent stress response